MRVSTLPRRFACWPIAAALGSLLLSACSSDMIPGSKRTTKRATVPKVARADSAEFRQCAANLSAVNVRYSALPDKNFGNGCATYGVVKLLDVGVPTTNLGAMTCPLAANFAAWARYGVEPAARLILGSEIVRIETFGTYSCRNIAGSGRISEHARGNAVDVAAFLLADGRRISVKEGWNGDGDSTRFLRTVRASACKRFRTVLSPDFNFAHHDHFHFDMGGAGGYCR